MQMSSVRFVAPRETEKMLETVIVVFHLLGALGVVALVLLQQGKGADAGASFKSKSRLLQRLTCLQLKSRSKKVVNAVLPRWWNW